MKAAAAVEPRYRWCCICVNGVMSLLHQASHHSPQTASNITCSFSFFYLTAWVVEPVVTHQTSWLESAGVYSFCSLRNQLLMHALHAISHEAHKCSFNMKGRSKRHLQFLIINIHMQICLGTWSVSSGTVATIDWQHWSHCWEQ